MASYTRDSFFNVRTDKRTIINKLAQIMIQANA